MYEVEKGVPIIYGPGKTKYPFRSMEVGDSFLADINKRHVECSSAVEAAKKFGKRYGKRFSYRKVDASKVRIWRTA